jgi:phosphatidylserine decarboxylase
VSDPATIPQSRAFRERPTEFVVRDAWMLGAAPLALAGVAGALGWPALGALGLALCVFVAFFFRNPPREIPGDARDVVAPADGRVLEAGEVERPDGSKALRVAIFLSIFDVHVNRAPLAGRVVSLERGGRRFRAAFDRRAEAENVRLVMTLETAGGARVEVTQITGLIARRIVCHPEIGEWIERGARYGLIRFGSRTDVLLPPGSELCVKRGDRVKGGSSRVARLGGEA